MRKKRQLRALWRAEVSDKLDVKVKVIDKRLLLSEEYFSVTIPLPYLFRKTKKLWVSTTIQK